MVKPTTRSAGPFTIPEMDYINDYFNGSIAGTPYCWLHIQRHASVDFAQLHISGIAFSLAAARTMRADFAEVKEWLRSQGIKMIVGVKEGELTDWRRLVMFLGFAEPRPINGRMFIEMGV